MSAISSIASSGVPSGFGAVQSQHPSAYVPQQVAQVATGSSGTQAAASNAPPSQKAVSNPTPTASSSAQIATPNVDLAIAMMQQQIAQIEFMSNAEVARVYSQMMQTLMGGI